MHLEDGQVAVEVHVPIVKKRRSPRRRSAMPERVRESVKNLDHAIAELQAARDELAGAPTYSGQTKRALDNELIEPLARINLVRRFCRDTLVRHGYRDG